MSDFEKECQKSSASISCDVNILTNAKDNTSCVTVVPEENAAIDDVKKDMCCDGIPTTEEPDSKEHDICMNPQEDMTRSVICEIEMPCCVEGYSDGASVSKKSSIVSISADEYVPCSAKGSMSDSVSNRGDENGSLATISSSGSLSSIVSFPEYDLKPDLVLSDVRNQLNALVGSRGSDLIRACRNFDRNSTYKINRNQLRLLLRMFCFPLTAAQFDALCKDVNMQHSGKLNYIEFFENISGGKHITPPPTEEISDDLPIDEVELRIKEKITPKLCDVIRSFWLFDLNKDGFVQKAELRRILRTYCFQLSDELFNKLWKSVNPKGSMLLCYKDFLIKLGINTDRYKKYMPPSTVATALCWHDKKSRTTANDESSERRRRRAALEHRDDPAIQGLPMEEVVRIFNDRLQKNSEVLKNCFNLFDYAQDGQISLNDFRGIINFFVMPMSPSIFNQVIKRFNIKSAPEMKMYYQDFWTRYCKPSFHTHDGGSSSKKTLKKLDCYPVVQRIKNHVLNPCARLKSVFTKIDSDKEWQITRQELRKAVEVGLDFRLSDDEFRELNMLLDPSNTNMIKCREFLRLFDGPCNSLNENGPCKNNENDDTQSECVIDKRDVETIQKFFSLRGKKLRSKLKHYLDKNKLSIEKMLLISDPSQTGSVSPERLHHILNGFCMPLTSDQFDKVMEDFQKYGEQFSYREFLEAYKKKPDEDTKKWIGTVEKLVSFKSRCPPTLPIDECEELLRESLASRKTAILKDFKALDMCNVGLICRDDARSILNKYSFRFNDEQFDELWKKFPVNKYNQLHFDKFLEEFAGLLSKPRKKSSVKVAVLEPKKLPPPVCKFHGNYGELKTKELEIIRQRGGEDSDKAKRNRKTSKEILYAEAPHLKPVLESMEQSVVRNIRMIRFNLHRADPKVTGSIDFNVFKNVLMRAGVFLSKQDAFHLLEHFDTNLTGKINYRKFLQLFVWHA